VWGVWGSLSKKGVTSVTCVTVPYRPRRYWVCPVTPDAKNVTLLHVKRNLSPF